MKRIKLTREVHRALDKLRFKNKVFREAKERERLQQLAEEARAADYTLLYASYRDKKLPILCKRESCKHSEDMHMSNYSSAANACLIDGCLCPNFISEPKPEKSVQVKTPPETLIGLGRRKIDL